MPENGCTTVSSRPKAKGQISPESYVAHDPFDGLVLPKPGLVEPFTFSLDEAKRILGSASEPHKTFYLILAKTGIRGGEICALRVADLDLENGVIYVRQSLWRGQIQTVKSRKGNRRFPISPQLVEHLRIYLRSWRPNVICAVPIPVLSV